jgi:dTDP-4-amino-4,6-dideoxygalactose transaminase
MTIPQTNPKANYLTHQDAIDAAVHRVLSSGWYILGQEVESFEREFAAYIGVGHAVGVGNGTDALALALQACGIGKGDLVFTVSHTAVATVAAIELIGAQPVLVDIDLATYTIDPARFEEAIDEYRDEGRAAAVIPVHLYGHPADISSILKIARRNKMFVVEDCAQSHGAMFRDRKTGAWGDIAAFSFYPTKNLGALGDGGMVVANDPDLIERVRLLRQYGWRQRYISELAGGNSRLDELHAAILSAKLHYLDQENNRRRKIADLYTHLLASTDLVLPTCQSGTTHVFHQYVIRTPRRDALQAYLHEQGIGSIIHYPQAVHQQPFYNGRLMGSSRLPHSELAAAQVLSLPMYPELLDEQVTRVADAIRLWCANA